MNKIYSIGDEEELVADMPNIINERIKAELEKIKAEIENIRDVEVTDGNVYANEFDVFEILDKHIAELKGENNDL